MAFIRAQKRKTKSGIRTYYYLVENKWENGKVKQKVLKYIGTNPNKISADLTVEQCTAILGSSILSTATAAELKKKFQEIGICVPKGEIEKLILSFNVQKKRAPSCSCNSPAEKYEPEEKECPKCGMPLRVKKTQKRRLVTPIKDTKVVEVIKRCNCSNETFVSKTLRKLTPQKSPYSFDFLAQIGRLRFDEHRQVSDIRRYFSKSGISIPDTTAQRLCKRFLKYFTIVHLECTPQIKEKIKQNGGYVLQIDGTQNHGRGTIMLLKDSIFGIQLFSERVVSEKADYIKPVLEDIRDL
ncbi:hypothetical protein C5S29_09515 [ANME-1 cluster archaeon GoMg3.2]|nr:hypothetical protein [ANME-1 cluster archaeon GoMg3.2]